MVEEVNSVSVVEETTEVKFEVRTRAKKGFEDLYELVQVKLDNLDKEIAKEFEARKNELLEIFNKCAEYYEAPVLESEVTETVANAEVVV